MRVQTIFLLKSNPKSPSVLCFSNFLGLFQMQILVFGDSHVTRLSSCSNEIGLSFYGIGGLKATDWQRHKSIFTSADVVILQLGGNDVSGHPRRGNITEPLDDTVRRIKEIMDFLKNNGKVGIVTTIISRRCAEKPIDLMNNRLKKKIGRETKRERERCVAKLTNQETGSCLCGRRRAPF